MSFAADMKDFNTAVSQGQKMVGATDDAEYKRQLTEQAKVNTEAVNLKNNDTEGQAADLRVKNANAGNAEARSASEGVWQQKARYDMDAATKQQAAQDDAARQLAAAQAGAVGGATVRPAPVAGSPAAIPAAPAPVQGFADGGAVDDGPDEPLPEPQQPAVPADADPAGPGTSDTTDISARSRGFSAQAGSDAVRAGLTYGSQLHGLHAPAGVDTPGRQHSAKAYASGAGAAPAEDMEKLRKQVDPEGKFGESEANLAALGAVYQFKMKRGDTEGAAKTAWQMLQYHRQASQRYAVIAAHAADSGDLDTATHAAMKAYANVPDGKDIKFQKTPDGQISYTYTDSATGKIMSQGIEPPDKLAAAAMGFAEKGFDQSLVASISGQAQPHAVDPTGVPLKPADRKAALGQVDDAWDGFIKDRTPVIKDKDGNATPDEKNAPKFPNSEVKLLKGSAFRVGSDPRNSRATPDEVMSAIARIAYPDPSKPDAKVDATPVDGGYNVDGLFVPKADYNKAVELRVSKLKEMEAVTAKAAADKKKADEPGLFSQILSARDQARKAFVPRKPMPPVQPLE